MKKQNRSILFSMYITIALSLFLSACVTHKIGNIPQTLVDRVFECSGQISATDSFKLKVSAAMKKAAKSIDGTANADLEGSINSEVKGLVLSDPNLGGDAVKLALIKSYEGCMDKTRP